MGNQPLPAGRVCLGQAQCFGQFVGCVLSAFGHRTNFFQKPGIGPFKTYKTSLTGVLMVLMGATLGRWKIFQAVEVAHGDTSAITIGLIWNIADGRPPLAPGLMSMRRR